MGWNVRALGALGAVVLGAASCTGRDLPKGERGAETARSAESLPGRDSPPFDVPAIARRVSRAYRAAEGGFEAACEGYAVRADGHTVTVTTRPPSSTRSSSLRAPSLSVSTERVARGNADLGSGRSVASVGKEGELVVEHGAVSEEYENTPAGVEQSFRFATEPSGRGDLVVRVRVTGEPFRAVDARGTLFGRVAGEGFRYGNAAWVDAHGVTTRVAISRRGDTLELRVPEALVRGSDYPARLDPLIGPEFPIDPLVYESPGIVGTSVASDGNGFIIVWSQSYDRIGGTRVAADGTVLDVPGITIASQGNESTPSVAFDGTNYIVVWSHGSGGQGGGDVFGARVSSAGVLLDAVPVPIATTTHDETSPAVACSSSQCMIAWLDGDNSFSGNLVRTSRVTSPAITLTDPGGTIVGNSTWKEDLRLAAVGTDFIAVWGLTAAPKGAAWHFIGADGVPYGSVRSSTSSTQYRVDPDVTCSPSKCAIAWRANDFQVSALLTTTADVRTGIALPNPIGTETNPVTAFDGTNFAVGWTNDAASACQAARVSAATGAVLDATGVALGTGCDALATNGSAYLVSWTDANYAAWATIVRTSDLAPEVTAPFLAPAERAPASNPDIAFDGTNYLVVWNAGRAGIVGARVSSVGSLLDPSGIRVDSSYFAGGSPRVAFGSSRYLVTWQGRSNSGDVLAARVGTDGAVLDTPIVVAGTSSADQTPAVAADGTNFLVVWTSDSASVRGSLIRESTGASAGSSTIASSTSTENPAVAFDGQRYFVVWVDARSGYRVYGARVTAATGAAIDTNGIALASSGGQADAPTLAFDGTNYLVAWREETASRWIHGTRVVAATGTVLDAAGFDISNVAAANGRPTLGFDGSRYVAIWGLNTGGVSAARIAKDKTIVDVPALSVNTAGGGPVTAVGPPGKLLVVYSSPSSHLVGRFLDVTCASSDTTCDGVDDDCDGTRDDDFVAHATSCGAGACASTGIATCVNGAVTDSCRISCPTDAGGLGTGGAAPLDGGEGDSGAGAGGRPAVDSSAPSAGGGPSGDAALGTGGVASGAGGTAPEGSGGSAGGASPGGGGFGVGGSSGAPALDASASGASSGPVTAPSRSDAGCSCRVGVSEGSSPLCTLLLVLLVVRRRSDRDRELRAAGTSPR